MPDNHQQQPKVALNVGIFQMTAADIVKLVIALIFFGIAWGTQETELRGFRTELAAMTSRMDKRDATDSVYLRSDVQAARDDAILTQLRAIADKVDRVQAILDLQSDGLTRRPR